MNKKHSLIEHARKKLASLSIVPPRAHNIIQSQFQYEIFNHYPPVSLLDTLDERAIFNGSAASGRYAPPQPLALYVHLPFCKRKCPFCCYFSITDWDVTAINRYIRYLRKEIELLSKKSGIERRTITSLYWGGGTPSLLGTRQIRSLMRILRDNFSIASEAELTFEATPDSVTAAKLSCFRKNGFNRLNIGVQSFNNAVLQSMGRSYTAQEAHKAFMVGKKEGFLHTNIDLLFGLPGQTLGSWQKTLDICIRLKPASVTTYPFSGCFSRPAALRRNVSSSGEREKLLMHVMSIEKFTSSKYIQITPYQFIRCRRYMFKQQEHKANNGEILGLGVTGHSFLNSCEYHNHFSFKKYQDLLAAGKLPVERGRFLDIKQTMLRFAVLGLQKRSGINRDDGGIDAEVFKKMFGGSIERVFKKKLDKLTKRRLIVSKKHNIYLSYKGLLHPTQTALSLYIRKDTKRMSELAR